MSAEYELKTIVRVDPDLSDLVPAFLEHKRADADRISAAADSEDYAELGRIGHKIKGEGGSYGFDAITHIGAEVERCTEARDFAAVRRCADELRAYIDSVEVVFE
jgi:HPt (histidine-containing phosphotransfer) domain-containing protein